MLFSEAKFTVMNLNKQSKQKNPKTALNQTVPKQRGSSNKGPD